MNRLNENTFHLFMRPKNKKQIALFGKLSQKKRENFNWYTLNDNFPSLTAFLAELAPAPTIIKIFSYFSMFSYRPSVSVDFLSKNLAFGSVQLCEEWLTTLGLAFVPTDTAFIDCKACVNITQTI